MVGVVALDKGNCLRKGRDITLENARNVLVGGELAALLAYEIGVYYRLLRNALGDVERGVVVSIGILALVVLYLVCIIVFIFYFAEEIFV